MKKILVYLMLAALLCGCTAPPPSQPTTIPTEPTTEPTTVPTTAPPDPAEVLVDSLTLEQQIGQMLLVRCPADNQTETISQYQFGGLVLFARDVDGQTPESLTETIASYQAASQIPMIISVDEEGGTVTRISNRKAFRSSKFPSPRKAYAQGGLEYLLELEAEKAQLLSSLGINVNLAPVCDIATDPGAFLYSRSLGMEPEQTGECIAAMVQTMQHDGVGAVLKHFPGYGNCDDTHVATVVDDRELDVFYDSDLIPFSMGFDAGAGAVMVSHNIATAMDPELPASLSPTVHLLLRQDLCFDGVIITDDLIMDAISGVYGEGEAAVLGVLAGNDMLCVSGWKIPFQAILQAVQDGRIDAEQIRQSALRVIRWKMDLGIL